MSIRVHLDQVLKAKGVTAKQLCELVGITEANMSILRSGKAKGVRFQTLNRICYHLQCDVEDILEFDGVLGDDEDEEKIEAIGTGARDADARGLSTGGDGKRCYGCQR